MQKIVEFYVNGKVIDTLITEKYNPAIHIKTFLDERDWNNKLNDDDLIRVALKETDNKNVEKKESWYYVQS